MSNLQVQVIVVLVFAAVHLGYTIPTSSVFSSVRKITFAAMDAKVEPVKYESNNINYKEETLEDHIDNHRMVIVTPDGYEYTASYEFTKNLLFSDDDIEEGREKQNIFKEITKLQLLFNFDDEEKKKPKHVPDTQQQQDIYNQINRFNNRNQVINTGSYPYNAVGKIGSHCSGTFVDQYVVLTAAHCIINNPASKTYTSDLNVNRAKPCNGQGIIHNWKYAAVYNRWLTSSTQDYRYNIGWIIVNVNSPVFMPFKFALPSTNTFIQTAGYPSSNNPNQCQFTAGCNVIQYTNQNYNVKHGCDADEGNSGSPIWAYDQGLMYIFAVQSHQDTNTAYHQTYNYGCIMTYDAYKLTHYYIKLFA